MSNKLIADINKKIAEKKKLNGPEQKVVKISLPQIDPKVRFDVLDSIYNFFQADRIGEDLYIKFDSGEKEDIYDELRSSLKKQLPEWWSQEKVAFPFIYNCPPPQIWIEVAYNITNDREQALEKIRSSKCYCCKTEFIIIVLPHGKEPYHQNPSPGSDSEEYGINIYQLGYGVRIYFNDILKYLTEDDDDYENPKPCPYCGVITELESLWEGVNLNRTNECPNGKDIRAALIIAEIIPNPKGMVRHIKENCQHDFY
ncbi:hypothetical protein GLOIN_2v1848977 [Rhizophagus irregularis DAOM 181602=DAOM 197198]|nr:hypothetical protein GLOIN_2v1848977 [Rhizophagus irregularis DAOM 181602=DAOM 197198]